MKRCLLALAIALRAAAQDEFFEKNVRPIFVNRCSGCHNPRTLKAGLDLTTAAGFYKGGDSGPVVDAAKPEQSRMLKYLSYLETVKMPPTGKLKDDELAAIGEWVKAGAKWPGAVVTDAGPQRKKGFTEGQRKFWSFQPIREQQPPAVKNPAWVRNDIDRFVLAKLEAKGLTPAPPASKQALLRRVSFDLTGLPPTPEELDAFLKDNSAGAYRKVVDRLLASPRYGERWGRHWLDVARYADSTGADEDHRYPDAWRYRDYVIQAFNDDLPYDRFVQQQLAGDLEGRAGIVATGFLAVGPRLIAEQDKVKMLYDFIDEQIDTTTRAFLGLTVSCARCHDHKFDPILTKDYYSLASIFANSKGFAKIEGTVSQMLRVPLVPEAEYEAYQAQVRKVNAKRLEMEMLTQEERIRYWNQHVPKLADYLTAAWRRESPTALDAALLQRWAKYLSVKDDVRPWMARLEKATPATIEAVAKEYELEFNDSRQRYIKAMNEWRNKVKRATEAGMAAPDKPEFDSGKDRFFGETALGKDGPFGFGEGDQKAFIAPDVKAKLDGLKSDYEASKKALPPEPPMAEAIVEGPEVKQRVFIRGSAENPGDEVARQFPVILAGENQIPITKGSGRLEFAQWLTRKDNPLPARVMVNRIWQGHFGEGLVRTPSNFGLLGQKPTHPELLDYLAKRFMDEGWSIKAMHRLMVLSATYQQAAEITDGKAVQDPENRLLSRYGRRRLDVEEIRDAMLAIDGTIDWTVGGSLQTGMGTDGENSSGRLSADPTKQKRRTVYLPLRRANLSTLLNLFDFGDATTPGEGRARTNVAPQALFMMNSEFVASRAKVLADSMVNLAPAARVEHAFLRVLSRAAQADEVAEALRYVDGATAKMGKPETAWQSFYRILLASNEFNYVD
jgi:mono/diheme cytochrome c family protein